MTNRQKGTIFQLLCSFFFCCMGVFIKLAGDVPTIEKAFFRNLMAMIIAFIILRRTKKDDEENITKTSIFFLFLRSFAGIAAMLCNFYAIDHLLLSDATTINKIAPFCTIFFSFLLLKEKPKLNQILFLILAFLGVFLVFRPGFAEGNLKDYFIALLGGVGGGFAVSCVRKLNKLGVEKSRIIFFFSTVSTLVCLLLGIKSFVMPTNQQILMLFFIGVMGTLGQFTMTTAYYYASAAQISIYDYFQILFASVFSIALFHEIPDLTAVFGYIVLVASGVGMFIVNGIKKPLYKIHFISKLH